MVSRDDQLFPTRRAVLLEMRRSFGCSPVRPVAHRGYLCVGTFSAWPSSPNCCLGCSSMRVYQPIIGLSLAWTVPAQSQTVAPTGPISPSTATNPTLPTPSVTPGQITNQTSQFQNSTRTALACNLNCESQAGLCLNTCAIGQAVTSTSTLSATTSQNSQCSLDCTRVKMVCRQACPIAQP